MSDRTAARSFAALFVLIGVLGFAPGGTSHYGDLRFAGGSHAQRLGEFRVSILLNLVHLVVGAVAIFAARAADVAVASLGLWLLGVVAAGSWLSLDTADNWLHFVLGVALLGLSAAAGRVVARAAV